VTTFTLTLTEEEAKELRNLLAELHANIETTTPTVYDCLLKLTEALTAEPTFRQVFTFGYGHLDGNGHWLYVVVYGRDWGHCRELMHARFGDKWCGQYDSEEAAGVQKFGLELFETIRPE